MRRPKRDLMLGDETFHDRISATLGERFGTVLAVGDRPAGVSDEVIPDDRPGSGPLGGVAAAIAHGEDEWVFVSSVDVPLLSVATIDRLCVPRLLPGQARVARVRGRLQPLVGAYATDLLTLARSQLESEDRSMMAFLRQVPHLTLVDIDDGSLRNINTPEEYADLVADFDG